MLLRQPVKVQADDSCVITPSEWPQKDKYPKLIKSGLTVHVSNDGRLFYCNHQTKTSSWLPPADTYDSTSYLPFGWEEAIDSLGTPYYINHVNQTTSREPPPKDWAHEEPPPKPRTVILSRDAKQGFGFVAGSEKPVIVRFVSEGGPSDGKLLPGDQILEINGEDVKKAPREHAIQLVRACPNQVSLIVCQPPLDNSARKSALLSVAKKARLKSHPSRVRFAEGVIVNGSPLFPPSTFSSGPSSVPIMPNVLKVFLENGQTKSFKYDPYTTVYDVVDSLLQKLCITASEHFSLMLEHVTGRRNKLTLLNPQQLLCKIASRPGSHNLRCLFRVVFVPTDPYSLLQTDPVAFEYLYMQCCNDVVQERFAPELKYDSALKLAALHIQQHALANNMSGKFLLKNIEKEFGLERFVPVSLIENTKRKELRKLLTHFFKLNTSNLSALEAKIHYLHIIGELPSYGAKCFSTSIRETNMETVILVSPKFGISQIAGLRSNVPILLAGIDQVTHISITQIDHITRQVDVHLTGSQVLSLCLEDDDAEEFVLVLSGYNRLLTGTETSIDSSLDVTDVKDSSVPPVPPYVGIHHVKPESWSYVSAGNKFQLVNLSNSPPYLPSAQGEAESQSLDSNMNNMTKNANNTSNGKYENLYEDHNSLRRSTDGKKEEAIRRVSEMQRLVLASQQYLNEHNSEYDVMRTDPHRKLVRNDVNLKHSDSLLLLSQGHKVEVCDIVRNLDISRDTEPSESDTDSPTNSPCHARPSSLLKASDSSFGLHSPDNVLPIDSMPSSSEIQEYLKRHQHKLYLDPDIIDLTMIPPPATPDNDGSSSTMNVVSSPPTPFADVLLDLMHNTKNWDQSALSKVLDDKIDLDEFLASVVIPAPCERDVELTPEEVSAFIIPPPPPSAPSLRLEKSYLIKADERVSELSERLLSIAEHCHGCVNKGGGKQQDMTHCHSTQRKLCNESKSLVTNCKLLVQAATSQQGKRDDIKSPLNACVNSLCYITDLAKDLSESTDSPSHTMALILRTREVSDCLCKMLKALDSMATINILQKCAENLVNALSALLRGLKVFTN